MVVEHQNSMFLLNCGKIGSFSYAENELGFSSVHYRIKSSRIHAKWIDILLLTNVAIEFRCSSNRYINEGLHRPATISQTPITVAIAYLY